MNPAIPFLAPRRAGGAWRFGHPLSGGDSNLADLKRVRLHRNLRPPNAYRGTRPAQVLLDQNCFCVVVCNRNETECRAWSGIRTEVLMAHRCSINCIVPPHILLKLLES